MLAVQVLGFSTMQHHAHIYQEGCRVQSPLHLRFEGVDWIKPVKTLAFNSLQRKMALVQCAQVSSEPLENLRESANFLGNVFIRV
jgi:hypothetical protein